MHKKLEGKEVSFVYVGIDCKEKSWKNGVKVHQLAGQHYHLDDAQSAEIRAALDISGIPFYVLIDQNGHIIEKGSHLRPGTKETFNKIHGLLE